MSTVFTAAGLWRERLQPHWRLLGPKLPSALREMTPRVFRADVFAGATVAMVSIPQAIGFALIAGLPPKMVLTSVIVGGFIAACFFASRHLVFGPSNSLSLLLAATFTSHAARSALGPAEMAVLLAVLIAGTQMLAGIFRLGQITQFISRSVIIGYGAAIGVLLILSQLRHLLGLTTPRGEPLWETALQFAAGHFNPLSIAVAASTFRLLVLVRRVRPRWPEALLVLLFFAAFSRLVNLRTLGIPTLGSSGSVFSGLPDFTGLPLTIAELRVVRDLLFPAAAIALLGMLEATAIAKTYAMRTGERTDTDRELVAMGLANLACACFAAMPGSASFARSAANHQAGARTQLAGILGSFFVLGIVLILAPLVDHLPVPSLAAALVMIGWRIIDLEQIRIAARTTGSDALTLYGTFIAALLFPLDVAIYFGVVLALVLALRKASAPTLSEYTFDSSDRLGEVAATRARVHPRIAIIHVEGELFFGAAELFQDHVRDRVEQENLGAVILRLKNARHIDATTVFALRALHDWMLREKRHLLISGVHGPVLAVLIRSGLFERIGRENIFPAEENYALATKKALLRAQSLLGDSKAEVRLFYDQAQPALG